MKTLPDRGGQQCWRGIKNMVYTLRPSREPFSRGSPLSRFRRRLRNPQAGKINARPTLCVNQPKSIGQPTDGYGLSFVQDVYYCFFFVAFSPHTTFPLCGLEVLLEIPRNVFVLLF